MILVFGPETLIALLFVVSLIAVPIGVIYGIYRLVTSDSGEEPDQSSKAS